MQIGWAEEHYMISSTSTDGDDDDDNVTIIMQPSSSTSSTSYQAVVDITTNTKDDSSNHTDKSIKDDNIKDDSIKDDDNISSRDIRADVNIIGDENNNNNNNNNHPSATDENGVGDDKYSWAYDGYRQVKWYDGKSIAYGPQTKMIWKIGDVIGCLLEIISNEDEGNDDDGNGHGNRNGNGNVAVSDSIIADDHDSVIAGDGNSKIVEGINEANNKRITELIIDDNNNINNNINNNNSMNNDKIMNSNSIKVTMTYYVNGICYGIAHQFYMHNKIHHQHHQQQNQQFSFFPAISIENNETIALNLGKYNSMYVCLYVHI